MCIISPLREKAKGSEWGARKSMYLGGRLESEILAAMIPEVTVAPYLVCAKNFGVTGSVQRASTNGAHVPFEGHFEWL